MEINKIIQGNNVEVIKSFPENFIDLTLTSPPYDNQRVYNGYSFDFDNLAPELFRITKHGGVLVWIVADQTINGSETGTSFKQALKFIATGFLLHDTMIYAKKNPMPMTHRRYEQAFEYMFVFSKGKPKTFNPLKEPCKIAGKSKSRFRDAPYDNHAIRHNSECTYKVKDEKQRTNIWEYSIGSKEEDKDLKKLHPASFPNQLAIDMILSWTNEQDIVMDCFAGSGTSGVESYKLNRKFVLIEISQKYCEIAQNRFKRLNIDVPIICH